jgi:hypothetical protein
MSVGSTTVEANVGRSDIGPCRTDELSTAESRKLEEINEAFAGVLANRVRARLVIQY